MNVFSVKDLVGGTLNTLNGLVYPISIGDFNMDGFPDMMISTIQNGQNNVELLESVICSADTCTGKRGFQRYVTDQLSNANRGVFMDFDEDVYFFPLISFILDREL